MVANEGDDLDPVLDNLPWASLTGPHAELAQGGDQARRYPRSMAVFCGAPRIDDEGWRALADLVGPGRAIVLFQPGVGPTPSRFEELFRSEALQMVADGPLREWGPDGTVEVVELGLDDAEEMVELTARTEPGPFFAETVRLGTYLGIRDDGELVAMAGERLHGPGVAEISAVCVDARARRRGLGGLLTARMAEVIRARGETPMLHVATTNTQAIPLYEQLGFRTRCVVDVVGARAPTDRDNVRTHDG